MTLRPISKISTGNQSAKAALNNGLFRISKRHKKTLIWFRWSLYANLKSNLPPVTSPGKSNQPWYNYPQEDRVFKASRTTNPWIGRYARAVWIIYLYSLSIHRGLDRYAHGRRIENYDIYETSCLLNVLVARTRLCHFSKSRENISKIVAGEAARLTLLRYK